MRRAVLAAVLAASVAGCAHVRQEYAAYDGPSKVYKGEGGTKTVTDGVEFWTSGEPAREYRVVGILTDQRRDQRFAASSFGGDVAAKVKEVGGDAVIILDQAREFVGTYTHGTATARTTGSASVYGNSVYGRSSTTASGSGFGVAINNKITKLLVVKYVSSDGTSM